MITEGQLKRFAAAVIKAAQHNGMSTPDMIGALASLVVGLCDAAPSDAAWRAMSEGALTFLREEFEQRGRQRGPLQ